MIKHNHFERVVFQPQTYQGMQRGINTIANAVRPTLGPLPRNVAITKVKPHDQTPEMLDNGGVIARRVQQIAGRDEDAGAMFIRQMLWRQHERMGDGTATAAVLFQSVYNEALRFIAAGGNAMLMRRYLESGLRVVLDQMTARTIPVEDRHTIAQVAESVSFDPELSGVLGEIFDIMGVYAQVDIRSGRSRDITREYVGGTIFEGGFHSQLMVNDPERVRARLDTPAIFLSNLEINTSEELVPLIQQALENGYTGLVVMARAFSDQAIGTLTTASRDPRRFNALAVKTPGNGLQEETAFLEDLAVLTGGRAFLQILADSPKKVHPEELGSARRVWADKEFLGFIGGQGDPIQIRQQVASLKARYANIEDDDIRKLTLKRLGKLMGGSASLFVGGLSEIDITTRKEQAEAAVGAVRGALLRGVLPGGGAALLACKPVLDEMAAHADVLEERVAYQVLSRALEEPTRTILLNAGYDPSVYLARIAQAAPGFGFDVRTAQVVDMVQAGIFDSAGVLFEALWGAVSSAALALTVDSLVHKKRQKIANRP